METTRRFERLPSDAGVPSFTGFEFAHIASRKPVVDQLRDQVKYCTRVAIAPAMCVVLGEWGEGKTEAFERYIEPVASQRGHFAYLVRASTVANSLTKVEAESPRASVNFLAAVFYAIQHEAESAPIPSRVRYGSVEKWLLAALQAHAEKNGRILVFVDEFEELILRPHDLRTILSGLKETINKQFTPIAEDGPYRGIISFFVSCTPDAYARMQRDQEIAEIFGSWERRARKIELLPVTRVEGVRFLHDLLRFAYGDELPSPLPIKGLGVFHTLQAIGRGNLGALVTLFTRLLNGALTDTDELRVIDGNALLGSLAGESIAIYGSSAPCVDRQVLGNVEEALAELSEEARRLFRLLAGELRPFSASELAGRLGLSRPADVSHLVGQINRRLRETQGTKAITRWIACRPSVSVEDLQAALQPIIRDSRIRVNGTERNLGEFEDELTYLRLEDGELVPSLFFPQDAPLMDTSLEGTRQLLRRVETLVDEGVSYYRLSEELVLRLFPSPVPAGLDYIRDRDLRLKLWRGVTARFPEQFRGYMPRALLELINEAAPFDIKVANISVQPTGIEATIEYGAQNVRIKARCYAHYGDIGAEKIQELARELEKAWPVHVVALVHVGDLSEVARREIQTGRLKDHFLHLPLHSTLTKHLLIANQCSSTYRDSTDERRFTETVTYLLKAEVEFDSRIRGWLEDGVISGLVIQDLRKSATGRDRELAEALRFYINVLDQCETPEDIFELDEQPERFRLYGQKGVSFAPDVATSAVRFSKLTKDLADNGFVRLDARGKVTVVETPVEQRLLGLLEQGSIAANEVDNHFVIASRSGRVLTDVYLDILQYKGQVKETRGLLTLVDRTEAVRAATEAYESYQTSFEAWQRSPEWLAFAHIYVTKKRDTRLIVLDEFDNYLKQLHTNMRSTTRDEVALQRAKLMIELIEHFQTDLLPVVESAIARGKELRHDFLQRVTDVKEKLQLVVAKYSASLTVDQIEEFNQLVEAEQSVMQLAAMGREELEAIAETVEQTDFLFDDRPEVDNFLNLTLHMLQQTVHERNRLVDSIDRKTQTIAELLESIRGASEEVVSRLRTKPVDDKLPVSKVLYECIEREVQAWQQLGLEELAAKPDIVLSLDAIEHHLQGVAQTLQDEFKQTDKAIDALDLLRKAESNYREIWKRCMKSQRHLKPQVDVSPYQDSLGALVEEITQIRQEHFRLGPELRDGLEKTGLEGSQTGEEIRAHIGDNTRRLEQIHEQLSALWPDYVADCQRFARTIDKLLNLVSKQDPSVSTQTVRRDLDGLLQVGQIDSAQTSPRMSTYESLKVKIRQTTLELMERSLSTKEGSVLMFVVEQVECAETDWLPIATLTEAICIDETWDSEDVEQTLYSLIHKGYLSEGVTIPV